VKLDGTTGQVKKQVTFVGGSDLFLTADSRLLVGSSSQLPGIFDLNLNQIATIHGGSQMFVTQAVPEPSTLTLLALGAVVLVARRIR
jgi:hypothetical protein